MSVNKLIPMPMHVDISWYILSIHKIIHAQWSQLAARLVTLESNNGDYSELHQLEQPHCNVVEWCLVRLSKGIYSDIQHAAKISGWWICNLLRYIEIHASFNGFKLFQIWDIHPTWDEDAIDPARDEETLELMWSALPDACDLRLPLRALAICRPSSQGSHFSL
jgi:hypothetical protein